MNPGGVAGGKSVRRSPGNYRHALAILQQRDQSMPPSIPASEKSGQRNTDGFRAHAERKHRVEPSLTRAAAWAGVSVRSRETEHIADHGPDRPASFKGHCSTAMGEAHSLD